MKGHIFLQGGIKANCNFLNLIGHLQGLPNHILAYHLFTFPWNIHRVQVTSWLWKETSFFDLYLTPKMKIKIKKKTYCTSTRQTLSYNGALIVCYLKCRWSSSDKGYMTENLIFRPSYDSRGQNENSVSLLHICKTCPIIS